jgi:glucose/arabinose dehydrogenase/PKD repeat protein
MQPVSGVVSRTTDDRGRDRGLRPSLANALAVSLAVCLLLSVILVISRPGAAVSGTLEAVLSGLREPDSLAFASDGRVFFGERPTGKIGIIENGSLLPDPFYLFQNVSDYHDQGLLGLALDPSFPSIPWVYAFYTLRDTANGTNFDRIVRIQASGDTGGSVEVLLDHIPTGEWHIGGPIKFGPDGELYALTGDTFQAATAQNLSTLAGKVLRLNPDGSVPADNPFVGNASANPYIYTYGHRNLFGIAFHPVTGKAYVTENGPECNDEINLLVPGRNYGWGANSTCSHPPPDPLNTNRDGPDPVLPLIFYTPPIAPTNAIFYTGSSFAAWHGDFFFGTWNQRDVRRVHFAAPDYETVLSDDVVVTLPSSEPYGIIAFEQGVDGAIWLGSTTTIYRFYDTSLPPVASFTASSSTPLIGDSVIFNGSGSYDPDGSIASYAWDFGDASSAAGSVATHSYSTYGVFYVTLVVTDFDNLTASQTASIRVLAFPTASFAFGPPKPLEGASVTFDASNSTDPDGTITQYEWNWGDGSNSTVSVSSFAQHTFATFGQYTVGLMVTDSDGLTNTTSAEVHAFAPPSAAFTINPTSPRAMQAVTLNGSGSADPDGTIALYEWDFGDGANGTGPTVQHTFAAGGNYSVVLTVTDSDGFTATFSDTVSVSPMDPPEASFAESATLVSPGTNVTFDASGSSDVDGTVVGYTWDFGDGTIGSGVTAVYAYPVSGSYIVTLTVLDNDGLSSSTSHVIVVNAPPTAAFAIFPAAPFVGDAVVFNGSSSRDPEGSLSAFVWDFGDTTPTATGVNVTHAYTQAGTYVGVLQVTDSVGWTDTKSMNVVVRQNQPPAAVLAMTPVRVNPGDSVTFDASGSTDSDGSIVSYSWSFGDGATAQGVTQVHAYQAPGAYTVALTVTDDRGASGTASGTVQVNAPPVASFAAAPTSAYPGVYVSFNASASADPDSAIVSYHWDFGDGTTAEGVEVLHAFVRHGLFTVRLVVTDDLGAQNETTQTMVIGNRAPVIDYASPQTPLVANVSESLTFQLNAADPDGDALTYTWTVNGVSVSESSPSYAFVRNATGTYVIKVVVSDGSANASFQWVVEVRERAAPPVSPWSVTSIALIGGALGVALVVLLLVVLMVRRRRSR